MPNTKSNTAKVLHHSTNQFVLNIYRLKNKRIFHILFIIFFLLWLHIVIDLLTVCLQIEESCTIFFYFITSMHTYIKVNDFLSQLLWRFNGWQKQLGVYYRNYYADKQILTTKSLYTTTAHTLRDWELSSQNFKCFQWLKRREDSTIVLFSFLNSYFFGCSGINLQMP